MHLLVTDIVTCPRCGPDAGLILLSRLTENRRVLEGLLGCPRCRTEYPVRAGFADLRPLPGEESAPPAEPPAVASAAEGLRLAALLGLADARGMVLAGDRLAAAAPVIAAATQEVELIADDAALAAWPERERVSRIAADAERLPFYDCSLRGVALAGEASDRRLEEAARVLAPRGRLVLEDAPPQAESRIKTAGLDVLAHEDAVIVAARTR